MGSVNSCPHTNIPLDDRLEFQGLPFESDEVKALILSLNKKDAALFTVAHPHYFTYSEVGYFIPDVVYICNRAKICLQYDVVEALSNHLFYAENSANSGFSVDSTKISPANQLEELIVPFKLRLDNCQLLNKNSISQYLDQLFQCKQKVDAKLRAFLEDVPSKVGLAALQTINGMVMPIQQEVNQLFNLANSYIHGLLEYKTDTINKVLADFQIFSEKVVQARLAYIEAHSKPLEKPNPHALQPILIQNQQLQPHASSIFSDDQVIVNDVVATPISTTGSMSSTNLSTTEEQIVPVGTATLTEKEFSEPLTAVPVGEHAFLQLLSAIVVLASPIMQPTVVAKHVDFGTEPTTTELVTPYPTQPSEEKKPTTTPLIDFETQASPGVDICIDVINTPAEQLISDILGDNISIFEPLENSGDLIDFTADIVPQPLVVKGPVHVLPSLQHIVTDQMIEETADHEIPTLPQPSAEQKMISPATPLTDVCSDLVLDPPRSADFRYSVGRFYV